MLVSAKGLLPVSSIQAHITGPRADKGERGNMVFHLTGMVHDLFLFFITQDKEAVGLCYPDMEACAQSSEQERLQG